jgi:hypothetical protein
METQAEMLGGLAVEHEFELAWLLEGQFARPFPIDEDVQVR